MKSINHGDYGIDFVSLAETIAGVDRIRPGWETHSACNGQPIEVFFPDPPGRHPDSRARYYQAVDTARQICDRCPVRPECLTVAVNRNERYGIWGGTSEHERRRLRKWLNTRPDQKAA